MACNSGQGGSRYCRASGASLPCPKSAGGHLGHRAERAENPARCVQPADRGNGERACKGVVPCTFSGTPKSGSAKAVPRGTTCKPIERSKHDRSAVTSTCFHPQLRRSRALACVQSCAIIICNKRNLGFKYVSPSVYYRVPVLHLDLGT